MKCRSSAIFVTRWHGYERVKEISADCKKLKTKMIVRLTFDQCKAVLKWYWKYKNIQEVQRQWQTKFESESPTSRTIARIWDKFENAELLKM